MSIDKGKTPEIQILGGGPAGLAVGYYAQKRGLNFIIFEAGEEAGGNCRTLRQGDFLFDTGAHRVHDKDPEITREIKDLLGDDLHEVSAPSEIYSGGELHRFPLELGNLASRLEWKILLRIAGENMRWRGSGAADNFGAFAVGKYGPTLANLFLLNYSRKLWGLDPYVLSTEVSGGRLKGLDMANFLRGLLMGQQKRPDHLDGSFLYPKYGIGMVVDRLCAAIGPERIRTNCRVSRLVQGAGRIERVVLNEDMELGVSTVVNTLPLTLSAKILDPPPPPEVLTAADAVKYRHLVLCVFGLDRPSFSPNASLYFPESEFPFTRIYEPKNRSPDMAPAGQTAIVVEWPCFDNDTVWSMPVAEVRRAVWEALQKFQVIAEREVVSFGAFKLPFAYPVLEVGFADRIKYLVDYFCKFENMHLTGRSSLFRYVHMHDLLRAGSDLVGDLLAGQRRVD